MHQFDRYCKLVLNGERKDYLKECDRRKKHEVLFVDLSDRERNQLFVMDKYLEDTYRFVAMGYDVIVKDALIIEALKDLPQKKRDVILLSYYKELTDFEIGKLMNLVQSTIHYHRSDSLQILKKFMEEKSDDDKPRK